MSAVFQGKVSGVRTGSTVITAIYKGLKAEVAINVTKASSNSKTGPRFNLSELVANTGQLEDVLKAFSISELKIEVPEQVIKEGTVSTNDFTTNVDLSVSSKVKKVVIRYGADSYEAIRTTTNTYERSIAGLKIGDEITIRAYDSDDKELQMLVFRLTGEPIQFKEDYGKLTKKEYSFKELTENKELFNELLRLYSISDLQVKAPLRYIEKITVDHTTWFTTFNIKTYAPAEKIIVEVNGEEYETRYMSDGKYVREITGIKEGDLATIQVFDEFGNLIERKVITIES